MVNVSEIAEASLTARLKKAVAVLAIVAAVVLAWSFRTPLYSGFNRGVIAAYRWAGHYFADTAQPDLYDLPSLKINIQNHRFLKIGITLELADPQQKEYVQSLLPKLNDALIGDGAALFPQDLESADGLLFFKEELLYRFNLITYPAVIDNLYFRRFELLP